jgi:hypothetical protein
MFSDAMNDKKENLVPLLPYGETLRPLIRASNLTGNDLRLLLQKRGIFTKTASKEQTIPILTSILLSPLEFFILRDSQTFKESTVKVSDAKTNWSCDKTIVQAIPDEYEGFIRGLVSDNSAYQLTHCDVNLIHPDEVVVSCSIERHDWTKDAFSSTSYHNCKFSISKEPNSNVLVYRTETTAPETKDLINKLQKATHNYFREHGAIPKDSPIQRILSNYFVTNGAIFEFIYAFLNPVTDALTFQKVIDIDAGVDHSFGTFPENFQWLKNNIDKINLHGTNLHMTDIMSLGEMGALIFGEIEAEFAFDYSDAKGVCTIKYGFPGYYEKNIGTEFEAKILSLRLHVDHVHVAKERVTKFLLQEFQRHKHSLFEEFKQDQKVNTRLRRDNQLELFEDGILSE